MVLSELTRSWLYLSETLFSSWMGYAGALSWCSTMVVSLSTPYFLRFFERWTFLIYMIFNLCVQFAGFS